MSPVPLGFREHGGYRAPAVVVLIFSAALAFGDASGSAFEMFMKYTGLYQAGKCAEAIPYAEKYLEMIEKESGKEDLGVASALDDLVALYKAVGNYGKAVPLCRRALALRESALGSEHPAVARYLYDLAALYEAMSDYAEAEPLLKRSVAIFEKSLGPENQNVAYPLNGLAELYVTMGDYAKAEPFFTRSLTILEKTCGPDHPDVAAALGNLGGLYHDQGFYVKAEPLYLRSLAITEKSLGPDHPETATSLNNLALLYRDMGYFGKAAPLFRRSIAIREKALGPRHPDLAPALNNLAELYQASGDYKNAEPLYLRSLAISEEARGPEHPDVALSLNNLAGLYREMGDRAKAESLFIRSREIWEKTLGPDHPNVARSLSNLGMLYQVLGDYAKAEPLYVRAVAIGEKSLGPGHADVAGFLNNLAELYRIMGDPGRAEPLLTRSLAIREKALGPEHPDVAQSLNNLALLYQSIGDYGKAEPLHLRSLAISEKALGPEHPNVAVFLNNLAELYRITGDYAKAEPLQKRSLAILEKALGSENPDVARSLGNLALVYLSKGDYGRAESLFTRSLRIYETTLGPEHPDAAAPVNNLAMIHQLRREWAKAEPLFRRSLAILMKAFGNEHPKVADAHFNLALLEAAQQRYSSALDSFRKGLTVEDGEIRNIFTIATERQKLQFIQMISWNYWSCLSLIHQYLKENREAVRYGLELVIRRKGIVLESQSRASEALRGHLSEAARADWDLLSSLRTSLSQSLLNKPKKASTEEHRAKLALIQQQIEEVEKRLADESALVARELKQRQATVEAVAKQLPAGSELIEFVKIRDFDFAAAKWAASERYLAFVLKPSTEVTLIDLGNAGALEQGARRALGDIGALTASSSRESIQRSLTSLGRLYQAVWAPLEAPLRGASKVLLSPDGVLDLVPFAALEDTRGTTVVERFVLGYIGSGRDLLGAGEEGMKPRSDMLLVANPDYEGVSAGSGAGRPEKSRTYRGGFDALPGTAQEAKEVAALVIGATSASVVLQGAEATEAAVKAAKAPRILHLATHGFFLKDQDMPTASVQDGNRGISIVSLSSPVQIAPAAYENPLVRSGLAFAGANYAAEAGEGDDGILTALEISGMDLWGTELVVLSACETGVGEVQAGEGVFGLRRSFELAGAKNLLMSLWPVGDSTTVEQMKEFYRRMGSEAPAEGLREAQLATLKKLRDEEGMANPAEWAPFIIQGAQVLAKNLGAKEPSLQR